MRIAFPGRPPRARRSTCTLVLSLALAAGALSGCSRDAIEPAGATASHVGVTTTAAPLATTAEIGRVVGRLPGTRRKAVRKEVTAVIDRWWEAAYLAGDRASVDLDEAFPGFTVGARKRATFDRELMTNADLDAVSVTPLMRKVRLDLLAVNQHVRSVTARFDLRVRANGESSRRLQVRGRLFLTKKDEGWRVFGYDVSKGWL